MQSPTPTLSSRARVVQSCIQPVQEDRPRVGRHRPTQAASFRGRPSVQNSSSKSDLTTLKPSGLRPHPSWPRHSEGTRPRWRSSHGDDAGAHRARPQHARADSLADLGDDRRSARRRCRCLERAPRSRSGRGCPGRDEVMSAVVSLPEWACPEPGATSSVSEKRSDRSS